MQRSNKNNWNVRFEVSFYGNDPNKGSFREINEGNIVFNDEFEIKNKLYLVTNLTEGGVAQLVRAPES